jgi:hypothetical protein
MRPAQLHTLLVPTTAPLLPAVQPAWQPGRHHAAVLPAGHGLQQHPPPSVRSPTCARPRCPPALLSPWHPEPQRACPPVHTGPLGMHVLPQPLHPPLQPSLPGRPPPCASAQTAPTALAGQARGQHWLAGLHQILPQPRCCRWHPPAAAAAVVAAPAAAAAAEAQMAGPAEGQQTDQHHPCNLAHAGGRDTRP